MDYYDADGDPPATRYVYIDDTAYTMEFYSGTFSNGTYHYETTLGEASHTFYFEFTDGNGGTSRLPTTGSYSGPEVEGGVVTVTGKILNNGQPVTNLLMYIYDSTNHPDETLIDESYTDNEGVFSFSFIHDPEADWYTVRLSELYYSDNTFVEWINNMGSFESDQIVLPNFDIYYNELFSPPEGATYKADDISDSNPIVFEWTDGGRSDIISYHFEIWNEGNPFPPIWNGYTNSTSISFNGILDNETKITAGTYEWRWWCNFGEGWNGNSWFKTLIIE